MNGKVSTYIVLTLSFLFFLIPATTHARNFLRTLRMGDYGEDVRFIQQILNLSPDTQIATSGAGSPGNESIFFGPGTKNAIMRLQSEYADDILKPAGLSQATGIAGWYTLKKINALAAANDATKQAQQNNATSTANQNNMIIPTTKPPFVTSVSPSTLNSNDFIQITGQNFDPTDNTVLFSPEDDTKFIHIPSPDSKTISLSISTTLASKLSTGISSLSSDIRAQVIAQFIQKGNLVAGPGDGSGYLPATIAVKTKNGTSNYFNVLVKVINK